MWRQLRNLIVHVWVAVRVGNNDNPLCLAHGLQAGNLLRELRNCEVLG